MRSSEVTSKSSVAKLPHAMSPVILTSGPTVVDDGIRDLVVAFDNFGTEPMYSCEGGGLRRNGTPSLAYIVLGNAPAYVALMEHLYNAWDAMGADERQLLDSMTGYPEDDQRIPWHHEFDLFDTRIGAKSGSSPGEFMGNARLRMRLTLRFQHEDCAPAAALIASHINKPSRRFLRKRAF